MSRRQSIVVLAKSTAAIVLFNLSGTGLAAGVLTQECASVAAIGDVPGNSRRVLAGRILHLDSAMGDDANPGTADRPLRSLASIFSLIVLRNGDAIHLHCGGIWRESVILNSKTAPSGGVTVSTYGDCAEDGPPVVTGADTVNALKWTRSDEFRDRPVFVAQLPKLPTNLFWNGEPLTFSRHPNYRGIGAEFNFVRSEAGLSGFQLASGDGERFSAKSLIGVAAYVRTNPWIVERGTVRDVQRDGLLTTTKPFQYEPRPGQGYYLEGSLAFLDEPGEWFHDASSGRLYVWLPGGANPDTGLLEAVSRPTGISVVGVPNVRVEGVKLTRHAVSSIVISSSPNTVVSHVISEFAGSVALDVNDLSGGSSVGTRVEYSTIVESGRNAVRVASEGVKVIGNRILRTNYGAKASGAAVEIFRSGAVVEANEIIDSGQFGIAIGKSVRSVLNGNHIRNACARFTDCGAVYAWGDAVEPGVRNTISKNCIEVMRPNTEGAVGGAPDMVVGIYLDNAVSYFDVLENTVLRIGTGTDSKSPSGSGVGIHIHGGGFNRLIGNTILQPSRSSILVSGNESWGGEQRLQGNEIRGNHLYAGKRLGAAVGAARAEIFAQEWRVNGDIAEILSPPRGNVSVDNRVTQTSTDKTPKWLVRDRNGGRPTGDDEWAKYFPRDVRVKER